MAAMGLQRTEVTCKSMTLEARTLRGAPMGKYPIHTLAQCSMHAEQLLNRGQGGLLVKIDVGHAAARPGCTNYETTHNISAVNHGQKIS